jgi:mRNA interferase MazF
MPVANAAKQDWARSYLASVLTRLTSTVRKYPSRVALRFRGRAGEVALDQMRAVDIRRLVSRLGAVSPEAARRITATLLEYFA